MQIKNSGEPVNSKGCTSEEKIVNWILYMKKLAENREEMQGD
jgi:hypothetical protein